MSGKSCASGSSRSAGSTRVSAGHELVLDALYERKRDKKSVRVLTVIVYVFCVSLAAIMLSLYYVFFWEPKDAHYAQRQVSHTVEPPLTTTLPTCFMPHTGRSNNTVNGRGDNNTAAAEKLLQVENNSTSDLDFDLSADSNETSLAYTESSNTSGHNNIT